MGWRDVLLGEHTLSEAAGIIAALLLLEAVLSFDNAAILAAMVRKLPYADRRKALMYGLVGAYALRISAIAVAAWLIKNPWLKLLGGGYLLFLFVRHFVDLVRNRGTDQHHAVNPGWLVRMGVPALVATIIQIELIDLAFALDQVIVAVAFTDVIALIIIASCVGILFLRIAAGFVARVMDWLPILEHMAYVAVGFVGAKLILLWDGFNDGHGYHVPDGVSLAFTFALFGIPVLVKLLFKWPRSEPGTHKGAPDAPASPLPPAKR